MASNFTFYIFFFVLHLTQFYQKLDSWLNKVHLHGKLLTKCNYQCLKTQNVNTCTISALNKRPEC